MNVAGGAAAEDAAAVPVETQGGWPLVWALSLAQLVSWGSIYYAFSLFIVPIEREFGWSPTVVNGALSVGLLTSGICAYSVGAWIDRHGGRLLMTGGSVLGTVLLVLWSRIDSPAALYGVWLGLGLAMAATLYEPVFAVLTRAFPLTYRTRITALTLVGGLASTVFIPLTQLFIDWLGWRHALIALALCNLLICLPIHLLLLRDGKSPSGSGGALTPEEQNIIDAAVGRAFRHPTFWGLATCFAAWNATFSALTFHIIPLLSARGMPTATIVTAIATIGPAQVAGRVVLLALGKQLPTAIVGRIIVLTFPASVLLLIAFPSSIAALFGFAVLYGAGNGIMTIIRGTAVPDLMWREGYGAINGALTFPSNLARAVAPFGAALIWGLREDYGPVLWSIVGGALIGATAFWYAAACATGPAGRGQT